MLHAAHFAGAEIFRLGRPIPAEYPRRSRGVDATRVRRGISTAATTPFAQAAGASNSAWSTITGSASRKAKLKTPAADSPSRRVARTSSPLAIYIRERDVLSVLPGLGEPKYEDVTAIDFHVGVMAKYYGEAYRQTGED